MVITQEQPISVDFLGDRGQSAVGDEAIQVGGTQLPVQAYDRSNTTLLATGTLTNVDNQINTTTGTVNMRATFPNEDFALFPNQFVNARLLVDTLHNVVRVPVAAVQQGAPGTFVYVINQDSTVTVRPIKLGPTDGAYSEVISGLSAGDRVVTDGTDRLRDGQKVTIPAPAKQAAAGQPAPQHRRGGKSAQ